MLLRTVAGESDSAGRPGVTGKNDTGLNVAGGQAVASRADGRDKVRERPCNAERLNFNKNARVRCDDFAMSLLPGDSAHKQMS